MLSPIFRAGNPVSAATPVAVAAGCALVLTAVLVLAGCSSASHASTGKGGAPTGDTSSAGANSARGARGPAASGEIAAVAGHTMQVQNPQTGQVAVSWSASTTFTQQVAVTASSVKAGDCVTAIAPSGTSASAATFTASTVSVNQPANGLCDGGFGGGGRPSGFPSGSRPSGFPSGTPRSGFPGNGAGRTVAIASGKVVSVSGSTIVVAARDFRPGSQGSSSSSSSRGTPATTNKTVTLTATTKITATQTATASAVKVGRCATAQGSTDTSGAVAATRISVTDPTNGTCTTGFGRFGGAGGPGA